MSLTSYGVILYASDDPDRVRDVATCLRGSGTPCAITAGITTYYAVREFREVPLDRAYLRFRAAFSAWVRERTGEQP